MTETGPAISTDRDHLVAEGHRLFAGGTDFLTSVFEMARLPPPGPLEVAFAGRSNVGKSSLINALCNRKKLAHTSRTPGRTQSLNIYGINDGLLLVDMPGYGYARAPKEMVKTWTTLIHAFLKGRATLRRVFVLVDARHGLKTSDHGIMDILDKAAVSYQLVLTKADKIGEHALTTCIRQTGGAILKRPAAHPRVLATSAEKKTGIADLRAEIAGLLATD